VGVRHPLVGPVTAVDLYRHTMPVCQPPKTPSYIVYRLGDTYYAENTSRAEVEFEGADAAEVVNKAIAGAPYRGSVLLKGVFEVASPVEPKSDMTLLICGVLKLPDAFNKDIFMLHLDGVSNVEVVGIGGVLDGNKAMQTAGDQRGIRVDASSRILLEGLEVKDFRIHGVQVAYSSHVDACRLYVHDVDAEGIFYVGCDHSSILDSRVASCGSVIDTTYWENLMVQDSNRITIRNVRSLNSFHDGLYFLGPISHLKVVDCTVVDAGAIGIHLDGGTVEANVIQHPLLRGNTVTGSATTQVGLLNVRYPVVEGNTLREGKAHGIALYGVEHGRISNNTLYGNGQGADNTYDEIYVAILAESYLANEYNVIEGNHLLSLLAVRARYCINESSGNYNRIRGNVVRGAATAQIRRTGGGTLVEGNPGYPTENGGLAVFSGDGATTLFTISHGLVGEPGVYFVEEASAVAGDAEIRHVTPTATVLNVYFKTAPAAGTDNVWLRWWARVYPVF